MARFARVEGMGNINLDLISMWSDFREGRREEIGATNDGVGVFTRGVVPTLVLSIDGEDISVTGKDRLRLLGLLRGMTVQ